MKKLLPLVLLTFIFSIQFAESQCLQGEVRPCSMDVGICKRGAQKCIDNEFTECTGVVPEIEVCGNGLDDNCNGLVDECVFGFWPFLIIGVVMLFLLMAAMLLMN